jgi:hypothetical protein
MGNSVPNGTMPYSEADSRLGHASIDIKKAFMRFCNKGRKHSHMTSKMDLEGFSTV